MVDERSMNGEIITDSVEKKQQSIEKLRTIKECMIEENLQHDQMIQYFKGIDLNRFD